MSHHKHHEKHHGSDSDSDDDRKEHHHDKHHEKHHEKHHGGEHRYEEEEEERRRHEGYRHHEGGGGYNGPPGPYGYGGHANEGQYGHQGYGAGPYGGGPLPPPMTVHSTQVSQAQVKLDGIQAAHSHETTYKRTEYAGAAAAILGAGVAMYEGHQAKIDPQHAGMHKIGAEIAAGVGVAGAGVGVYGHHKKEQAEEQLNELEGGASGHKKKPWF